MTALRRLVALAAVLATLAACGDRSTPGTLGEPRPSLDPAHAEDDEAARALLLDGLEAGTTYYGQSDQSYEGFDAEAAAKVAPDIEWIDAGEPEVGQISITEADETHLHLVTLSESGLFFCLRSVRQFGGGEYLTGYGATLADVDESGECKGQR